MRKIEYLERQWVPQCGKEPEINDIATGWDIGRTYSVWFRYIACEKCGKKRWVRKTGPREKRKKYTGLCIKCQIHKKRRIAYSKIGGGRGYIFINVPDDDTFAEMRNKAGYIKEHRLVMAQKLGRCLKSWECVHHKNGIKNDNRPENLELLIATKHAQIHLFENRAIYAQIRILENRVKYLEKLLLDHKIKFNNNSDFKDYVK